MSETNHKPGFDAKVAELIAVTKGLNVAQTLMLRRMTLADPESLKWATERELKVVFDVILDTAMGAMEVADLGAAADQHFEMLLPPGSEDDRDQERWMLFDLSKKFLGKRRVVEDEPVIVAPPADDLPDEEILTFDNFAQLFDETLARHAKRTLLVLAANTTRPHFPPLFLVAPGFAASYDEVIRKFVLPDLRATRRIKELAASRKWDSGGSARLLGIVQSGETNNPILHPWDSRWDAFKPEGVGAKLKARNDPWAVFRDAAAANGFAAPLESDIGLLRLVLRWEAEQIVEAWREVALTYQQEFAPKNRMEQARPGATRDAMVRIIGRLSAHSGELVAIKAFCELPKVDRQFLRMLIQSVGSSDTERRRVAPVLITFYGNLPK
jgi:hypothetical protein